jgi:excisionase family DNA binding protein
MFAGAAHAPSRNPKFRTVNELAELAAVTAESGTPFAISDGGGLKFMDMATFPTSSTTGFQPQLGRSVTIDQAAALLGLSRRTVYYRIREGRLLTVRTIGGSQRVLVASLAALKVVN